MAFKKYLIYFERIKVAHKNLKRLQMGRNISTKDRSGQDLIEPHKSESKRTKMSPTSFPWGLVSSGLKSKGNGNRQGSRSRIPEIL